MKIFSVVFLFLLLPTTAVVAFSFSSLAIPRRKASSSTTTSRGRNPPRVQRHYETWQWNPVGSKDTFNINYKVSGDPNGQPVLLTHGFGANLNHFRYTEPALVDAGYKVYSMDLLGFGASDKAINAPYSVELFGSQIQDFILNVAKETQPWILIGNSLGSLCSLQVAAQKTKQWPRPNFGIR